ncbi:prephenate dehydrogenase [Marinoscillum sp. MHG1-6]|uniref:prephenate dehydrogenase n=1 Tax=Marinoscillum sp. MHG1-6 TaxID=2959627 RepID=UPI002157DEDE|nr:prephenate dehydrogenase [Marinoscillum sp. MHG1-6]
MKKVLLVGVGLIGGSYSLALKPRNEFEFGGFSRRSTTLDMAEKLGIIQHKFDDLNEGVQWADWIILSIPVDVIRKLLPGILDIVKPHQLVVDFGSTKGAICEEVKNHPNRANFLPAHPIAGTEYSGPEAAFPGLFQDKCLIVCEEDETKADLKDEFEEIAKSIGFYIVKMGAEEHDRHLAYISHLSHVTSFALSNTVLAKEKDGEVILELAGSGFASTVRLAKSSPEMWTPIFLENKKMILEGIDAYLNEVQKLRDFLSADQAEKVQSFLESGREIRRIIQ